MIFSKSIEVPAYGPANLFDITDRVLEIVRESKVSDGNALLFSIGSTGALVKLPRDEGVQEDFIAWVRFNLPFDSRHRHPGNAFAHLRSMFLGCQLIFPIIKGQAALDGQLLMLLENTAGRKRRRIAIVSGGNLKLVSKEIKVKTNGWIDLIDITSQTSRLVKEAELREGNVLIYARDEKTAIVTLEAEMALILDTADFIDRLVSQCKPENRGSIASAILGSSIAVPLTQGYLDLGAWQQIMLVDLGAPGEKKIGIQIIGE